MSDIDIMVRQAERITLLEANQATFVSRLQTLEQMADQERVNADQKIRGEMADLRKQLGEAKQALKESADADTKSGKA